jgi:EAL domain-containing protein (putative c-di-GMP-specific phosphodiesterase class I)/GGDEF domain-containing protein
MSEISNFDSELESNLPQLREFSVQYNEDSLFNKAVLYGLNLEPSILNFLIDLDRLASINVQMPEVEKNEAYDQLLIVLTSWPLQTNQSLFTTLINSLIESWIVAALAGTNTSHILLTIHCLSIADSDISQRRAFHQFLSDLVCETLFQHQSYQVDYLLEHDTITNLPNNHVLNRELNQLTLQKNAFSLLTVRFIIERGTTSISPAIPADLSLSIVDILISNLPEASMVFHSSNLLFTVVLDKKLNEFQLSLLYARIKGGFESVININSHAYLVMPVVGAVLDTEEKTSNTLLHQAKLALDNALVNHQDMVIFNPEIAEVADQQKKIELEIIAAFNNEDLELYLQPIIALPEERCVGAEVLLRWPNATTKGIYPNVVVEIINKVGLGKLFTRWLVHSVCRLVSELIHQHQLNIYLTLNIRAEDLYDIELPFQIKQSCEFWKVQPSDIILEITENGILEENETTTSVIRQMTENGFKLALDDFGTGYSSMARLRNMPISLIKIDQSFVKNIDRSMEDIKIVESMTLLGLSLGKEVLVEGLETAESLKLINQIGIKKAQGYYFSKPMPFHDFIAWSKNRSAS